MRLQILLCTVLLARSAGAQGTVIFSNLNPVNAPFYDGNGVLITGSNYVAQLYAGYLPQFLLPVPGTTPFRSGAQSGYFHGGVASAPNIFPCYPAWFQVRAWERAGGSTFEGAARGGFWTGVSTIVYICTGGCGGGVPVGPCPLTSLQYPGNPLIVSNPQSTKARDGESAGFSVVASGGITLFYQWYLGQSGDTNAPITGATNAVYVTPPLTANANFWVRAQTAVGFVDSSTATVTVYPTEASVLELERTDDALRFSIHAPQGAYILEESTNLAIGNWGGVTNLIISSSPLEFLTRADTNSSARFYRLRAE